MDRRITRLAVVHPGALGDTILALPVLAALKQCYAPATLHLIGHPGLVSLLPGRSVVDSMTSVDGPEYRDLLGEQQDQATRTFWKQFRLVVVWASDTDKQIGSYLSSLGVPHVVRSPGLRDAGIRHATDRFCDTVAHLLGSGSLPEARLSPTDRDHEDGRIWLSEQKLNPSVAPVVAVHPGSGSPSKCWPVDRFVQIIRTWLQESTRVVLVEGPADREPVTAIVRRMSPVQVPRLCELRLPLVAGVLAQCSTYVGNDSGLTQLAAALGVPSVGLYGPTDHSVWAVRNKNLIPLRGSLPCRCPTSELQRDCPERVCLSIQPEQVLETVQQLLLRARLASDPSVC